MRLCRSCLVSSPVSRLLEDGAVVTDWKLYAKGTQRLACDKFD